PPYPGGQRRDASRLAVRRLAPLRLCRVLHVRGRRATRRASSAGTGTGPRAARRAARGGRAARAARPGRGHRGRARAPGAVRRAGTHAPFTPGDPAARWGIAPSVVVDHLAGLVATDRLVEGTFRPGGTQREFADADVLRLLRRRTLARLRREVEAVPPAALGRFL